MTEPNIFSKLSFHTVPHKLVGLKNTRPEPLKTSVRVGPSLDKDGDFSFYGFHVKLRLLCGETVHDIDINAYDIVKTVALTGIRVPMGALLKELENIHDPDSSLRESEIHRAAVLGLALAQGELVMTYDEGGITISLHSEGTRLLFEWMPFEHLRIFVPT